MTNRVSQLAVKRAPRISFAEPTPTVLRSKDGLRTNGKLKVVSLTGGLLSLSSPLNLGSQVKIMFLTRQGSVLGAAEMLSPLSGTLQPFKFVGLHKNDQGRLQAAIQSSLDENLRDYHQIERYRAW